MMTPRDAFGLIVRSVALAVVLYGLHCLLNGISYWLSLRGNFPGGLDTGREGVVVKEYALLGAGYLAIGAILFKATNAVVNACYPVAAADDEHDEPREMRI